MKKYMAGYCWRCCKDTKQEVINAKDSKVYRVFEAVCTFGIALAFPVEYKCERTKCGHINTLKQ